MEQEDFRGPEFKEVDRYHPPTYRALSLLVAENDFIREMLRQLLSCRVDITVQKHTPPRS